MIFMYIDYLKDRGPFCLVLESSMLSIILSHGQICVHLAVSEPCSSKYAPSSFAKQAKKNKLADTAIEK